VNCEDFFPIISAAVDDHLEGDERRLLQEHLAVCASCRTEFELEQLTKQFIRQRAVRAKVPDHVSARIFQHVAQQANAPLTVRRWLEELLPVPSWRTSFAAAGILIVVLSTLLTVKNLPHSHTQPRDSNIIHQTFNYFDSVLKGQLIPTVTSNDPLRVESALSSNVNFKVHVPKLKRCTLVGGMFTNYNSEKIAHVIYQYNDKLVYLYQTGYDAVEQRGGLELPAEARTELKQRGWYFENHLENCSLIIWLKGSTVCVALADMNRKELLECLNDIH
jgi:anti-sigma factor RsiW